MRQILNTGDGGYEVLKVEEVADPTPQNNELLIDVRAAGINFADILARKGTYQDAPPKPCVMGYEVSGVVEAIGSDIDPDWRGREVIATTRFKGQAEKVVVAPSQVFEKPDSLSFEQAAALPVNYITAWVLIEVMGSLQPYESILIHNAGGGVGLAALEVARHIGATTYGTASPGKHEFLLEKGLDHPIDYRNNDWYEEVMEMTEGRGLELIIDPLGGKEWKRSYKALRSTGRLGMFGVSSASDSSGGFTAKLKLLATVFKMPFFHPVPLIDKNRGVFGVNVGHLWHEQEKARHWVQQLLQGVEDGWLSPHVDETFTFDEVADAHRYIEERRNIGKVVLVP
ncbi:medium chain dehydrogenase/reductase family protein [Aliifodinibius sp. S!AR15-10]|uniref:synaptic vesicle VAT-1 family membrane protein n=1 Tax=Aliifodinibius sp. S!AR15-10 TaxID=2950437 RepID=UPI0028555658|nr:medium chain dehydrogenase/reductase family protein [Aliifodinibius sp. S!AR15-10]MDR8391416.1 medium chain dehydrogenase/reductase family protein [Aliifodinibius sp. S!AR15-10]